MTAMLQIATYLAACYLVLKGVRILRIGLAAEKTRRVALIVIGALSLAASIGAGVGFVLVQDDNAHKHSSAAPPLSDQSAPLVTHAMTGV